MSGDSHALTSPLLDTESHGQSGASMDREVSEREKIMALTWKDLMIRVQRNWVSYGITVILLVGIVWIIPLVYFIEDKWEWQVQSDRFTPGIHGGSHYDWRKTVIKDDSNAAGQEGIVLAVKKSDMENYVNKFRECYENNYWWAVWWDNYGGAFPVRIYNSDDFTDYNYAWLDENKTYIGPAPIYYPTEDYNEVYNAEWQYDKHERLRHNSLKFPYHEILIYGVDRNGIKNIAKQGMSAQYLSTCSDGTGEFFDFPITVSSMGVDYTFQNGTEVYATFEALNEDDFDKGYEKSGCTDTGPMYPSSCALWNKIAPLSEFFVHNTIKWDPESWDRNITSVFWVMLPGILFLFVIFFTVGGFFMHVVDERNSGIKTIMMSMGLSNTSYMAASYLAYLIEISPVVIISSFLMAATVSDACGNGANGFYVFFAWVMTFMNMGPFLMFIACFISTEKNASSVNTVLKWVIPLVPTMLIVGELNSENGAIRFFTCLIPPLNFAFCLRDAIRVDITPEPVIALFFNFFFWWSIAYYFDLTMSTASATSTEKHCFCCRKERCCFGGDTVAFGDSQELSSSGNKRSMNPNNSLLVVKNLVKDFGSFRAVAGMNLNIEENTIYGLLGFNGAGKTTTINMITGILSPTSGTIHIGGKDISTHMNQVRAYIGMCPQHNVLFDLLTVEQHMYLFGRLRGMSQQDVDAQMTGLLKAMGMYHQKTTYAENLSGGQKRMLCMIQAFLGDPKLILLDEPTSGVDAESRRAMWDFIIENKRGRVIILTTHQMREADVLCDKIGIMSAGQLLVEDTPLDLKNKYSIGFTFVCANADENEIQKLTTKFFSDKAEVVEEIGEIHIQVPAEYADAVPEFVSELEVLPSVKDINVHAATLENVFLELARNVDQKGRISKLKNSFMGGTDEIHIPEDAAIPQPLERRGTMQRLDGLSTDLKDFTRPNPCVQLFYLLIKRAWLSIVYWEPMVTGVAQSVTLAMCVTFVLFLAGQQSNPAEFHLSDHSFIYSVPSTTIAENTPTSDWNTMWKNLHQGDLVNEDDYLQSAGWETRTRVEEPWYAINETNKLILWDVFYMGGSVAVSTFYGSQGTQDQFEYTGQSQSATTDFLVMPILVLGVGLIISSTWHHIGKEIQEGLYDYQIQNGVNPILLWCSHWVWDVCINTIMLSIFLAIALHGEGKALLRAYAIWGGLVAFLPYVVLQYIVVWMNKNDKVIENLLTWSTFIGIGIFIGEMCYFTKTFTEMDPLMTLFGPETIMWNKGADYRFFLLIHYFVPPIQFMHGMFQALFLFYGRNSLGHDKDVRLFYNRFWYSLISALIWGIMFLCLQLYYAYKPDPQVANQQEMEVPEDVKREKELCRQLREKFDRGETDQIDDLESGSSEFPMILADGLQKVFTKNGGPFIAVNDISFHVNKGECFGLLGKNGAGKSTTMNMITTLMSATMGHSILGGYGNSTQQQQIIGYCPQKDLLWQKLTVYQHLLFFGLMKGVPMSRINDEITALCVGLTLDPYYSRATGKLSGGNKRKVQLATALIGAVDVVFLDEPSTGVDPFARKCMMDVIQRYLQERSIILTTHMMEEVDGLCNRVGIMVNGDFRCVNTINELINDTNSGYQMEISLSHLTNEEKVTELKDFTMNNLPGSIMTEHDSLVMAFQIPGDTVGSGNKLSKIFEVGSEIKKKYNAEYVISQMTMDQLFLQLTQDQEAEEMVRGEGEFEEQCCFNLCCCPKGSVPLPCCKNC